MAGKSVQNFHVYDCIAEKCQERIFKKEQKKKMLFLIYV